MSDHTETIVRLEKEVDMLREKQHALSNQVAKIVASGEMTEKMITKIFSRIDELIRAASDLERDFNSTIRQIEKNIDERFDPVEQFVESAPDASSLHDIETEVNSIVDMRKRVLGGFFATAGKTIAIIVGLGIVALIFITAGSLPEGATP